MGKDLAPEFLKNIPHPPHRTQGEREAIALNPSQIPSPLRGEGKGEGFNKKECI
jgi:hypothetical protein